MQEVIPMRRRAYGAIPVNQVDLDKLLQGRDGVPLILGTDIGKFSLLVVCRWADGSFERPWRLANPADLPTLLALLARLRQDRQLTVAMESSGTYGDALRQALADQSLPLLRVSGKAAHDYAEVFDGVPSQHDGKDAAVVAELAALGKAASWPYLPRTPWQQELAYWVEHLIAQR